MPAHTVGRVHVEGDGEPTLVQRVEEPLSGRGTFGSQVYPVQPVPISGSTSTMCQSMSMTDTLSGMSRSRKVSSSSPCISSV